MQRLLSTGETPCASHPMHKMWATFCRQVTTRLRCSSQLPWLQKSEMVECWSYWNHWKYGMELHCISRVFISTILMFPFDCPQLPKVQVFSTFTRVGNSHCVTTFDFQTSGGRRKVQPQKLGCGFRPDLKLSHWNNGGNCELCVCYMY